MSKMREDTHTHTCGRCGRQLKATPHRLDPKDHHKVTWSVPQCTCVLKCLEERVRELINNVETGR